MCELRGQHLCGPVAVLLQYKKPKAIVEMEKFLQMELKKLKAEKQGDVECNQS